MLGMTEQTVRRSFLTRLKVGAAAAVALGGIARAQSKPAAKFEPARHDKDDWFDDTQAKHRVVFDTTKPEGFAESLLFANNFINVNKNDYGLAESDVAVVIVARHVGTIYAFNDAMFAKYSAPLADGIDLKGKEAPKTNPYKSRAFGSIDALTKQGVRLAVCSMATRRIAGTIARATGGDANKIFEELTSNLVDNARMVPAGIVAASRAQERGYTFIAS
jgi:intracellular sulfur oxidation DsrE/DsrF family protein